MSELSVLLERISELSTSLEIDIQAHLDDLTKPAGSLGQLESIVRRIALLQETVTPVLPKKRIYTFAADHGVTDENVSAFPREVTPQMVLNMVHGGAAVNVLSRHAGAEIRVVDMGVDADLSDLKLVISRKIKNGTNNMTHGPAMTTKEAANAVMAGAALADEAVTEGVTLLGIGEMGIGNTTSASAIMHLLVPCAIKDVVGVGTGVDDAGVSRKRDAIQRAVNVNQPNTKDAMDVLAKVGGLEIAGMTGMILGAAANHVGIVVDGFIASAAALVAIQLAPAVKEYLFFSHCSAEKGHRVFLHQIGRQPILDLGLRLGEGTGAALAMGIIDASVKIYNEMATFSSAGVSEKK